MRYELRQITYGLVIWDTKLDLPVSPKLPSMGVATCICDDYNTMVTGGTPTSISVKMYNELPQ